MLKNTFLSAIYKTYLFCLKITGIWPFEYDSQLRRFKFNSFYSKVSYILLAYILIIYLIHVNQLLNAVKILIKNIVLKMVSNIYISSNVLNVLFLYITQTGQWKKIRRLIYRTINLNENLSRCSALEDKKYLLSSYLIKFTIKSLVFAVITIIYLIVSMTAIAPNVVNVYVLPAFILLIVINKFYPDIHYGGLLLIDYYLIQINQGLRGILNIPFRIGKESSDIVEHLDTISINYIELIKIVKDFNRIMSFRVVLWILIGLLNFIIHLFMEFVFMVMPIRYGHSLNIVIFTSGLIDLCYQFLEFWFTASICTSVVEKVEETKTMLSSMYVRLQEYNGPLERSVNVVLF